jgi:hypothetical protein
MDNIQRAVEIVKSGNPEGLPKTKDNKRVVDEMGRLLSSLASVNVGCSWCARGQVYKHLRKWLEGNGHL